MKVILLILAALCLVAYYFFGVLHWPGKMYLVFGSVIFFLLGSVVDYRRRRKQRDILDDEFLDDV